MKSMLVIGTGDFGHHLVRELANMGNEILVVDKSEETMEDLVDVTSGRIVADCSNKSALEQIGVSNFDVCFVCVGSDFRSNILIVNNLKELNAKHIVSEIDDEMLERFLVRNGADDIIHPNKDSATRAAVKYSNEHIFDYLQLKSGYSIFEISPLPEWVNKTILESHIRERYDTYIIGIVSGDDEVKMMPGPNTVIQKNDRLMVLCHEKTMEDKLFVQLER